MTRVPLVEQRLLDPQPAVEAAADPIADAVNIPFAELSLRTHELPPREVVIPVVGPAAVAEQAVAWLTSNGRQAIVERSFRAASPNRGPQVGRLWRPNEFLAGVLPNLPPKAALDLACGTGRDAVFLASLGWRVTAVDILPDALARARDLAARCAAAIEPIHWRQADLEREPPGLDGEFDLIVCFRYLHRPLLAQFAGWLRRGGNVIYETFTTTHRARQGKPTRAALVLEAGELPRLLAGFEIRHFSEAWRGAAHTARIWAVKV